MKNTAYTISDVTRKILNGDHQDMLHRLIGNEDHLINLTTYQKECGEQFIRYTLKSFEQKLISEQTARKLLESVKPKEDWNGTFDMFEQLFQDLTHFIINKDYYTIVERVERGQSFVEHEKDPEKKEKYQTGLNGLTEQLNGMEVIA